MPKQIVFLSLSGVGNSTVKRTLVATGAYANGVTCTTRPPRPGEVDGVDYDFISPEEYVAAMDRGEMAEKTKYRGTGTVYGILQRRIDQARNSPVPTIWVLDLVGLNWMNGSFPRDVTSVFLWADKETCRWRLAKRGESPEGIERRQAGYAQDLEEGLAHALHVIDTDRLTPEEVVTEVLKRIGEV